MSWDVFVFAAPSDIKAADLPSDFRLDPLGAAVDVRRVLIERFPAMDLSDPAWGRLVGASWSIEVSIGSDDPVDSIMLHVRGGGDDVLDVVAGVATAVGGRALDVSSYEFLDPRTPDPAVWQAFQDYRDRVICSQPQKS
jgi:hypothetical protein